MTELEQKAKKELMERLAVHIIIELATGKEEINVVDKTLQKDVLTKRFKRGWILKEDFDANYDLIVRWERLRDFINTTRRETRELDDDIISMKDQILGVESGRLAVLKPMLPRYKEILESDKKTLIIKKRQLEEAKIEFAPIKNKVKSLKNKFKLYIQNLS